MPSDQFHEKLYQKFRTFFDDAEEKKAKARETPGHAVERKLSSYLTTAVDLYVFSSTCAMFVLRFYPGELALTLTPAHPHLNQSSLLNQHVHTVR